MRLYDKELSGNCYKIRLMLSFLELKYESIAIDTEKGEQKRPTFIKLNPRGQIPVLEDDDLVFWDSQAILVYLASRYNATRWYPLNPIAMSRIQQWLALSGNEIQYGLAKARAIKLFGRTGNIEEFKAIGKVALDAMESRLRGNNWLALATPTIADVACYPYVKYAPQGEISLKEYVAVNTWLARFEQLPGYVRIDGIQYGISHQSAAAAMEK
ncbi:MAG: glutathione S-transferase family protein [Sulfuricaulis sp.]